jgi:ribosomal protein S18 acetylase RimI-like enzyme
MDEFEFRLARKSDLAAIAELSRDYIEHGLGWSWTTERVKKSYFCRDTNILVACAKISNSFQEKYPKKQHANAVKNRKTTQHRASQQNLSRHQRIIGFGIMHYGTTEANLNLLAVIPSCRRKGVAKYIVQWLEKSAMGAGIDVIYLQCRAANVSAQLFYQKLGYRRLRDMPKYYSGRESAMLMGHDLLLPAPNLYLQRR